MTKTLNIYGICKHYGDNHLLQATEIGLQASTLTLLVGANGSGKTTLLRILAGLERPDYAEVVFDQSKPKTWRKSRRLLMQKAIYLHQRAFLLSGSVLDNLNYALSVTGVPKRERAARVEEALAWGKLETLTRRDVSTLSGGEQQRVALVRACLTNPEILLLDEAAANIDTESRALLILLLEHLKQRGLMIIMSSHDPQCFYSVADEQLKLEKGRLEKVTLSRENFVSIMHEHPLRAHTAEIKGSNTQIFN